MSCCLAVELNVSTILSDAVLPKLNFDCSLSVKEVLKPDEEETLFKKTIKKVSCCFTFDWNI